MATTAGGEDMRAIAIDDIGQPATLRALPRPEPQAGEVLIRLRAAGVNPLDEKVHGGALESMHAAYRLPLVLGFDGAGVVARVGAGVTRFAVGDEVFALFWPRVFQHGTYAEYMVAAEDLAIARKPAELDWARAAALPMPGGTARASVDWLDLQAGDTLLVVGATGGVGSIAVQLAKARGARVIATARAEDQAALRGLGADELVDYSRADVAAAVRAAHPDGIDALLDLVSDAARLTPLAALVRDGGRLVTTLFAADVAALGARGVRADNLFYRASAEDCDALARLVVAGDLRIPVLRTVPLADGPTALDEIAQGHARGKLVLTM